MERGVQGFGFWGFKDSGLGLAPWMLGSGLGPDRLGAYRTVGTVLVLQSLFSRNYKIDILDHCLHFGVLGMRNAQALVQSIGFMLKPYCLKEIPP